MRWLFLFVVFDLSAEAGGFRPRTVIRIAFPTEEACNSLGREFAKSYRYKDPSTKSFSICIPEDAYEQKGPQILDMAK
jgi:hypothetical protein